MEQRRKWAHLHDKTSPTAAAAAALNLRVHRHSLPQPETPLFSPPLASKIPYQYANQIKSNQIKYDFNNG